MEIIIDKSANINSHLNDVAKSSLDWQLYSDNLSSDFYKLRYNDGVFDLYFKSMALFGVLNPVSFRFQVSREETFDKIKGKVQFSNFLYLSVIFAIIVFVLMVFVGDEIDGMALIFLLLCIATTFINSYRLRNRAITKSKTFFEHL